MKGILTFKTKYTHMQVTSFVSSSETEKYVKHVLHFNLNQFLFVRLAIFS